MALLGIFLISLLIISGLMACMPQRLTRLLVLLVAGIAATIFGLSFKLIQAAELHPLIFDGVSWFTALHLQLTLRLDPLSLIFVLLISGIGALVMVYAFFYMRQAQRQQSFFSALTLFMFAMLGLVLADNLLLLFIFWELTTISSYLLITYQHEAEASRFAALQALLTTFIGGLCLLVALILIGLSTHLFSFSELLTHPQTLLHSTLIQPILILIFIAAFTKSAQFPFHYWLPGAMKAPTPVSAYLHSATMVNAGIYLLARLHPLLSHSPLWYPILSTIGLLTMLIGAWLALRETDLKLILAYTTIFALGSMVYLLAVNLPLAILALIIFLIAHALYKASLFMLVGYIDKRYGSREIQDVSSLWHHAPIAAIAWIIGNLSMAGVPLLFGFMGKQLMFEMKLAKPELVIPLEIFSLIPSILVALQSFKIIGSVVKKSTPQIKLKPGYTGLLWSPAILAVLTFVLGCLPELLDHTKLLQLLLVSMLGTGYHLAHLSQYDITDQSAWYSLLIAGAGFIAYLARDYILKFVRLFDCIIQFGPEAGYRFCINRLPQFAGWVSQHIQNSDLRFYLGLIWLFLLVLLAIGFSQLHPQHIVFSFPDKPVFLSDVLLVIFVFISAFSVIWFGSTIASLLALGIFGLGMALIFLIHGAPDVAMTQILVELLLVIFFVINLYRLPILRQHKTNSCRSNTLAAILGFSVFLAISGIMMCILSHPVNETVNQYYLAHSLNEAHGRNVVNVILIDFRALDTLGEILVITASAIGVFGLVKRYQEDKS